MAVYFVVKNRMKKDQILSILWQFEVGEHFEKFQKHCRQNIRADFASNTRFLAGNKQKMDSMLGQIVLGINFLKSLGKYFAICVILVNFNGNFIFCLFNGGMAILFK